MTIMRGMFSEYGQITEFNEYFGNLDTPLNSPTECIKLKLNYATNNIPIMIGSAVWKRKHSNDNPLGIHGYFITNGIAKCINNIKAYIKLPFNQFNLSIMCSRGYIFKYNSMFDFSGIDGAPFFSSKFLKYVRENIIDEDLDRVVDLMSYYSDFNSIEIFCEDAFKFYFFFKYIIRKYDDKDYNSIPWRIITPSKIILHYNPNTLEYMKINSWLGKNNISNDLFHYNIYYDKECTRKVVYSGTYATAPRDVRMIGKYDKNVICPVSSPSDIKCGLVNFLAEGVYLSNKKYKLKKPHYINGVYSEYSDDVTFHYEPIKGLIIASNQTGWLKTGKTYSSLISFNEYFRHNPPTRVNFAMKMLKQAIGPFRPINMLVPSKWNNNKDIVVSVNVAIMAYKGYNVEDAVVVSKRFCSIFNTISTYVSSEIGIPLEINVKVGDIVEANKPVGSVYQSEKVQTKVYLILPENTKIVKIFKNENSLTIISLRKSDLIVGDKVASVHGQKGVISHILSDPLYTDDNREIDLIINPHAFPSRKTMGQIIEMGSKTTKINGIDIIFGKCRYMALKQQVYDKINYRIDSRQNPFTMQYCKGKKSHGGIAFGEMERNCAYINGCNNLINDYWAVDRVKTHLCLECGLFIANKDVIKHQKRHKEVIEKEINYSSLVIIAYLRCGNRQLIFKDNKWKITRKIIDEIEITKNFNFGYEDPLDIRKFTGLNLPLLPNILRNEEITKFYDLCLSCGVDEKEWSKMHLKLIKGKKGLFHISQEGKRINNFLRSVITPDPTLSINEIRVPYSISYDSGILCRQPSLNKNSLRFVRVLKGPQLTIQLSPCIVTLFNGDFDGDEMNVFFLTNNETIKECQEKMPTIYTPTQDYLLDNPELITADKVGIETMIIAKSKGNETSFNQIYNSIGCIYYNQRVIRVIEDNYSNGVNEEDWYYLCIASREAVASIAINTPYCGDMCNNVTRRLF